MTPSAFRIPHSAFGREGVLASLLFCFLPIPSTATPVIVPDSVTIVGANSSGPYWVSGFFIITGSEQIASNHTDSLDYSLDPNTGRIHFARALNDADTVTVRFQRLGFALRSRWSLSNPAYDDPPSDMIPISYSVSPAIPTMPLRSVAPPSRLDWQGRKSFSVTAASGANADWSQGMDLAVQGELLQGLRLSAALSDRQVGATTSRYQSRDGSRIGDLNRFYVEAQSPTFHGRWGELRLETRGGASRRVAGLRTEFNGSRHSMKTYVARPQGETRRAQIPLREGELGPYAFSGSTSQSPIVFGSQVVWLDGLRLNEGYDADYTVDAARGALTLSPRVRFSRQSQLVVEFEESLDDYRRTMAGAQWGWQSVDSARSQSLALSWEGDDPAQPLFGSLTSDQKAILSGTSDGRITTPAVERVGEKSGDYTLSIGPDDDSVFVYAGPQQGDWRVRFQWVGEGRGRYRHLVDNAYEYVGSGLGHAEPSLTLAAPRSQMAVDESLRLSTGAAGDFALDWQGIGLDQNRFSTGSSSFRSNHSLSWSIGEPSTGPARASSAVSAPSASRSPSTNPSPSAISAPSVIPAKAGIHLSWLSQRERSLTQNIGLTLARSNEEWRLRDPIVDGEYDQFALSTNAPVAEWFSLTTNAARLTSSSLSGWRTDAAASVAPAPWLNATYRARLRWLQGDTSARSRTSSHESVLRFSPRIVSAEAGWRDERLNDALRYFAYDLDASSTRWMSLSRRGVVARQEWRSSHDRAFGVDERSMETSLGLAAPSLGAVSGSGLTILRGERSTSGGEGAPYYGGRLGGTWSPVHDLLVTADFDLSHRRAGSQREVFIPTRPGQGDYRLERGEYISNPQGDFRRVLVDDARSNTPAYDAAKSLRLNWRPAWRGARWTLDASRRIDARYSANDFAPGSWLLPWNEMSTALLPGARLLLRDDDRLSVQVRQQSRATVIFAQERQLSHPAESARDDDHRTWRIESEWREELSRRSYISIGAQYHRRTRSVVGIAGIDSDARAVLTTFGYTPVAGLGLAIESRMRRDREFAVGRFLDLWGIRPTTRLNSGALSGTLAVDFTWLSGGMSGYLSPFLAEGRPPGFSFTESAELRWQLPSRISLNARLSGDHRPTEPDRWRMQIETVATF